MTGRRRRSTRPLGWCAVVVLVLVLLAAAVVARSDPGAGDRLLPSGPDEVATARVALAGLPAASGPAPDDYRRAAFGSAWTDTDGNGCNQRDDVLLRDVTQSAPYRTGRQGECDHDMLAGTWLDPYSGSAITLTDAKNPAQAQLVQIDHVVPLSVAWRDGAFAWSAGRRLAFANDLRNLLAVGGSANQAKGGSDAAGWRPVAAAQCGYAVRYVTVKSAYRLAAGRDERVALSDMLAGCS